MRRRSSTGQVWAPRGVAPLAALLLLGLGGCHLLWPFTGEGGDPVPCTAPGQCDPRGTGLICEDDFYVPLPCRATGCDAPGSAYCCGSRSRAERSPDKDGYCDPKWSDCVGLTPNYNNCETYCQTLGMECCDDTKLGTVCTRANACIVSRNWPGEMWGLEAWESEQGCASRAPLGYGQNKCAMSFDAFKRFRCCCVPQVG